MQNKDDLERVADNKPSRLERRLARNQLKTLDAVELSDKAGFGTVGRIVIGVFSILGVIAAMIPTLLYFAIILTPLLMMYTCLSHI